MPSVSLIPDKETGGDLLLLVGPTAVGKTALSLNLAASFRGEIISGDSMQVYRYMNIGTAKATEDERSRVPHHLIDLVDPDYPFSLDVFQTETRKAIREIQSRGNLPMIVGGTGLYIQSVTHGYRLPGVKENPDLRQELNQWADQHGSDALHRRLRSVDPETAARLHPNDRRRLIRALEVYQETGKPLSVLQQQQRPPYRTCWIGLYMPREQLYRRVDRRVEQMMADGLVEEVIAIRDKGYQGDLVSMQALGYKEIIMYLEGKVTLDEAVNLIKRGTRKFAKRQLSWFRRLKEINWFDVTQKNFEQEIQMLVAGNFPLYKE